MSKRKRLITNILMGCLLAVLMLAGALVYFTYYPRVTIYFIDEYQIMSSVELKKGNILPNLPTPVKTGNKFLGWYTDENYQTEYKNTAEVDNNLELFAKFEKILYNLQFRIYGFNEDIYPDQVAYYNDAISLPTGNETIVVNGITTTLNEFKEGYNFKGWTLASDGSGEKYTASTGFDMLPSDTVLYAKWEPKTFNYSFRNITYTAPGQLGAVKNNYLYITMNFTYNEFIAEPVMPEVDHYTFEGWYYDSKYTQQVDFTNTIIGANGEFIWKGNTINETDYDRFIIYGKFEVKQSKMKFDLNVPADAQLIIKNDSLYNDVDVYYGMLVQGTLIPHVTGNVTAVSLLDNTREIYMFAGWNRDPNADSGFGSASFAIDSDEDTIFYATWRRYYYLTFVNDGEVLEHYNHKMTLGAYYNLPAVIKESNMLDDVVKTGHHFAGWSLINNGEVIEFEFNLTSANDVTFYAVWQPNEYITKIGLDGGTANPDIDLSDIVTPYNSYVTLPNYTTSVTKEGYQMRGWVIVGKNGQPDKVVGITELGANQTFRLNTDNIKYATFVESAWIIDVIPNFVKEITITYDTNGGELIDIEPSVGIPSAGSTDYTIRLHSGDNMSRPHYTFEGWSISPTATEAQFKAGSVQSFSQDTTLYAVWKVVTYKVQVIDRGYTGQSTNRLEAKTFDVENPLNLTVQVVDLGISVAEGYSLIGLTKDIKNVNNGDVAPDYAVSNVPYEITVDDVTSGTTLTLYTVIVRNTYTVEWFVNGEQYGDTVTVGHGSALTHPADPEVAGYLFQYWAIENVDQLIAVPDNSVVTTNMQIIAVFEKDVYTLTFVYLSPYGDRDVNLNSVQDYEYEGVVTQEQLDEFSAKLPSIPGYTFDGWYASTNPDMVATSLQPGELVTAKTTYYSHYTPNPVLVTFDANGGDGDYYATNTFFDTYIILPSSVQTRFTKDDYYLAGWELSDGTYVGDIDQRYTIKFESDTTLYAVWKEKFTLTYAVDADTTAVNLPSPTEYIDGTAVLIPTNIAISKDGSTFAGVWMDQDGNTYLEGKDSVIINKDITLTPSFGIVKVTANFIVKDSINNLTYTISNKEYNYGDQVEFPVLSDAQLVQIENIAPNHRIDGWALASTPSDVLDEYSIREDTTFVLKLTKYYKIIFNRNGGSAVVNIPNATFVPNEQFTLTDKEFTRRGYIFLGWATSADGDVAYLAGETITLTDEQDVTLYAVWQVGGVTVVFNSNNGTNTTYEISGTYEGTITLPDSTTAGLTYANHRLIEWYKDNTLINLVGKVGDNFTLNFEDELHLYAKWVDEYSIKYSDGNGNEYLEAVKYVDGDTLTLPENTFTVAGLTFLNWQNNGNTYLQGDTITIDESMATDNVIVFEAKWQDAYYDVNFVVSNPEISTSTSTQSIKHGETATAPTQADTTNYKFLGWSLLQGGEVTLQAGDSTHAITGTTTYYAVFIDILTITYMNGGSVVYTERYIKGTIFGADHEQQLYSDITSENMVLVGYTDSSKYYAINDNYNYTTIKGFESDYTLTSSVTLIAVFTPIKTITLSFAGSTETITNVIEGDIVDLTEYFDTFTKPNYEIVGFSLTEGGNKVNNDYQVTASNVTLYPLWDGLSVDVTFALNNGTTDALVQSVKAGQTATAPEVTYAKHEFSHWSHNGVEFDFNTTINEPITLTAEWTKLYYVSFELGLQAGETYTGELPEINADGYKANQMIDLNTTIETDGLTFVAWDYYYGDIATSSNLTGSKTLGTDLAVSSDDNEHNLVFHAVWQAKQFTLTISNNVYDDPRGTMSMTTEGVTTPITTSSVVVYYGQEIVISGNTMTVVDVDSTTTIYNVEVIGQREFVGWGVQNGDTYQIVSTFKMPAEAYNLFAIIEQGKMNVTFALDNANAGQLEMGGNYATTFTQEINTEGTTSTVTYYPSTGYEIDGWYVGDTKLSENTSFALGGYAVDTQVVVRTQPINQNITILFTELGGFEYLAKVNYKIGESGTLVKDITYGTIVQAPYDSQFYFEVKLDSTLVAESYRLSGNNTSYQIAGWSNFTVKGATTITITIDYRGFIISYYDGDSLVGTQNVTANHEVGTLKAMENKITTTPYTGYSFVGWYLNEELTEQLTTSTIARSDFNAYAKWEKLYKVTFDAFGGAGVPDTMYKTLTQPIDITAYTPTKSNYSFTGWNIVVNGASREGSNYILLGNTLTTEEKESEIFEVTILAVYEKSYTANFRIVDADVAGGVLSPTQTGVAGTTISTTNTLQRSGYTLTGWKYYYGTTYVTDINIGDTIVIGEGDVNVAANDNIFDLYFEPIWQINNYTLTISATENANLNITEGGTSNVSDSYEISIPFLTEITINSDKSLTIGDVTISVSCSTGYTFEGFVKDGESTILTTFTMPYNDLAISTQIGYGKLQTSYSVYPAYAGTFSNADTDENYGSSFTTYVTTAGPSLKIIANPNNGYTFEGWYLNDTKVSSSATYQHASVNDNLEFVAKFTVKQYNNTFITTTTNDQNLGRVTFYNGAGQQGAYALGSGISNLSFNTTYGNNIQIYVSINDSYHVVKDAVIVTTYDDGTSTTQTLTAEEIRVSGSYIRIKFKCEGKTDITVNFGNQKFGVHYLNYDTTNVIYTQSVEYGHTTTPIASVDDYIQTNTAEDYKGYRFVGWYIDEELTTPFTDSTVITKFTKVYSKWQNLYKIVFDTNGASGTAPSTQIVSATTVVSFANALAKEGQTLIGFNLTWSGGSKEVGLTNGSLVDLGISIVDSALITANPVWQNEGYTIIMQTNDASRGKVQSDTGSLANSHNIGVTYGDEIKVSGNTLQFFKPSATTPYATYTAVVNDEGWKLSGFVATIGSASENILESYIIGDLTGKSLVIECVFTAGELTISYEVFADYAGSENIPLSIKFEFASNGTDVAYVNIGSTRITTTQTISATNGTTFDIVVPRNSSDTYVKLTVTSNTGYTIMSVAGIDVNRDDYTTTLANITRNASYAISAKLKTLDVTIASNNYNYGTIGYSYTLRSVDANGYYTSETGTTYNASSANSAYTITIPYFTKLKLTATANNGYEFSNWSNGQETTIIEVSPTSNTNYTATFEAINYTYNFVVQSGSTTVTFSQIANVNVGDDITSQVEAVATPTTEWMNANGFSAKWFDGWNTSSIYTDGKVIVGTNDVTIYASLSTAYTITVKVNNKTNGSFEINTTNSATCSFIANNDGSYSFKIKEGTVLPEINTVTANAGYHFTEITAGSDTLSTTIPYSGYVVNNDNSVIVNFALDVYTFNYLNSNGETIRSYTSNIGISYLFSKPEDPAYVNPDEDKVYTFVGWSLTPNGTILTTNDKITDYEHGAEVNIYPVYTVTQKYLVTIINNGETVYQEYNLPNDEIDLANYLVAVSGKQLLYFSSVDGDDGKATTVDNRWYINYLWSSANNYRVQHSGSTKSTLSVPEGDITLTAIYTDIYTITLVSDVDSSTIQTNNYVAHTSVNMNYFKDIVNGRIAPHYQVNKFIYTVGGTSGECNNDANIIITDNMTLSFTRTQLSANVRVYVDETKSAFRVGVVQSGVVINSALSEGVDGDGLNVLPYYYQNSTWNSVGTLDNATWAKPGYTFVGYLIDGTSTFYNKDNINNLVMGSTDIALICQYRVANYNLTLNGDLPAYKDSSTTLQVTYLSRTSGGESEVGEVSTLSATITNASARTLSVAYGTVVTITITPSVNAIYTGYTTTGSFGSSPQSGTATTLTFSITTNVNFTFAFEIKTVILTLQEGRDYNYGSNATTALGHWEVDGVTYSTALTATMNVPYGSTITNTGLLNEYNWKGTNTTKQLQFTLNSGVYYKLYQYYIYGEEEYTLTADSSFTAVLNRTFNVEFSSSGTVTDMPTGGVYTLSDEIPLTKPSKTGYSFLGWNSDIGGNISANATSIKLSSFSADWTNTYAIVFTPKWEANPITISLTINDIGSDNGASWSSTSLTSEYDRTLYIDYSTFEVYDNYAALSKLNFDSKIITLDYFTLDGVKVASTTNFKLTGNVAINAVFTITTYTVTLVNDGTNYTQTVNYGTTLSLPTRATNVNAFASVADYKTSAQQNFEVENYDYFTYNNNTLRSSYYCGIYKGISTSSTGGVLETYQVTGDTTLYAIWEEGWGLNYDFGLSTINPLTANANSNSSNVYVNGGETAYSLYHTFVFRAPISEDISVTFAFKGSANHKYPLIYSADSANKYYYLRSIQYNNNDVHSLLTLNNSNVLQETQTSNEYTFTTDFSDYDGVSNNMVVFKANYLQFAPYSTIIMNTNDNSYNYSAVRGADTSITTDQLANAFYGIAVGENIVSKLNYGTFTNSGGAYDHSWITGAAYRDYYTINCFSTNANTIANKLENAVLNTTMMDLLTSNTTLNLYAVWQLKTSMETICEFNGNTFTGLTRNIGIEEFAIPEWNGFTNGSQRVTNISIQTTTSSTIEKLVLNAFITSIQNVDTINLSNFYLLDHLGTINQIGVDPNNSSFAIYAGLLCSKDGSVLHHIPDAITKIVNGSKASLSGTIATITSAITTVAPFAAYIAPNLEQCIVGNIKNINTYAFFADPTSSKLANVYFASVTYLGSHAFSNCAKLSSLSMPTYVSYTLGDYAFSGCTTLPNLNLTKFSGSTLPAGVFYNCSSLVYAKLPTSGLTTIASYAFYGCNSLRHFGTNSDGTYNYALPEGITAIKQNAFSSTSLQKIILPSTINNLSSYSFRCDNLYDLTMLSPFPTTVTASAFSVIPYHFYFYKNYETAYSTTDNLWKLFPKPSNSTAAGQALSVLKGTRSHYVEAPEEWFIIEKFTSNNTHNSNGTYCNAVLIVGLNPAYKTEINSSNFTEYMVIPSFRSTSASYDATDVTKQYALDLNIWIGSFVASATECNQNVGEFNIKNIILPHGSSIGGSYLANSENISTTDIVDNAKQALYGLNSIVGVYDQLGSGINNDNVIDLEYTAFVDYQERIYTTTLATVDFKSSVYADTTFRGLKNLVTVNMPNTTDLWAENMFAGCTSVTTINLGSSAKELIGGSAAGMFAGCSVLSSLTFSNVTTTPTNISSMFRECHILPITTTNFLNNIFTASSAGAELDDVDETYAVFSGEGSYMKGMTQVPFLTGMKALGQFYARSCSSTMTITIPYSIVSVDYMTFVFMEYASFKWRTASVTIGEDFIYGCAYWSGTSIRLTGTATLEANCFTLIGWNDTSKKMEGNPRTAIFNFLTSTTSVYGTDILTSFDENYDLTINFTNLTYITSVENWSSAVGKVDTLLNNGALYENIRWADTYESTTSYFSTIACRSHHTNMQSASGGINTKYCSTCKMYAYSYATKCPCCGRSV